MRPEIIILFIILGVIGTVVVIVIGLELKRNKDLGRCAADLGFTFRAKTYKAAEAGLVPRMTDLMVFSRRDSVVYNVLKGMTRDVEVCICDSDIPRGNVSTGGHPRRQTVVVLRSPKLQLPPLSIRPKKLSFEFRLPVMPGFENLDLAGQPAFSSKYQLYGKGDDTIRGLFEQSTLDHFAGVEGLSIDGLGDTLALYRVRNRVKPHSILPFLKESFQIFDLFAHARAARR